MEAHAVALERGGLPGIRDRGSIEAAIARPYLGYDKPIYMKAAALVQSLAGNHGFVDGNKRTALIVLALFLRTSGYKVTAASDMQLNDDLEQLVLDVVNRSLSLEQLRHWLKNRIAPIN